MAGRRTRAANYNTYSDEDLSDDEQSRNVTAMQCELFIEKEPVNAIIDSGAATSIITHKLMKKLGYQISAPSKVVIVTTNGAKVKPLGIIKNSLLQ